MAEYPLTGSCKYFAKTIAMLRRQDIPKDSPLWWRYDMLLAVSWERTGTAFGPITLSNPELALLWETNEETARKGLAEMCRFHVVTTKQEGRTGRTIQLLFAWRGQGKDSAPAINQPEKHALHLDDQATAAGVPTREANVDHAADTVHEGGKQTTTLERLPNVVVGTGLGDIARDIYQEQDQQQQVLGNKSTKAGEGGKQTTTLEAEGGESANQTTTHDRVLELLSDCGVLEPNRSLIAKMPHMTEAYLLPWVEHAKDHPQLGGGAYVLQFQKKVMAPRAYRKRVEERERWRLWNENMDEAEVDDQGEQLTVDQPDTLSASEAEPAASDANSLPITTYAKTFGDLKSHELWMETLRELRGQMTNATFDTWFLPSYAVGFEDGALVVAVHTQYAQEWIENRMLATVTRTLTGIAGRIVEIKFIVQDKNTPKRDGPFLNGGPRYHDDWKRITSRR